MFPPRRDVGSGERMADLRPLFTVWLTMPEPAGADREPGRIQRPRVRLRFGVTSPVSA
jgi:hypothetical protein